MRIISGRHKGRRLLVPKHGLRPTKDFTREAFFNIIEVGNKSFLDLFAGSGSVGLEAISRGGLNVTFVDKNSISVTTIKKNLSVMKETADVIKADVRKFLELNINLERFDYIYFDPPYETNLGFYTLTFLDKYSELNDNVTVVHEHSSFADTNFNGAELGSLFRKERRKYGDSVLSFFSKKLIQNNKSWD